MRTHTASNERPDEPSEASAETRQIRSLDVREARIEIPTDASATEIAAITSVLDAYVRTERQRAMEADDGHESVSYVDRWTLTGRMRSLGKHRFPHEVAEGSEWKAASRAFPR